MRRVAAARPAGPVQGIGVRSSHYAPVAALLLLLTTNGCMGAGLLTDGTSVSVGTHATGALRGGRRLPFQGDGYLMPARWQERRRNYGTDELVGLLVRSARMVRRMNPGALLGIADLSPRGGGGTPEHRSHRSGRDVDLLYYLTNLEGKTVAPSEMVVLNAQGVSVPPVALPTGPEPEQPPPASAPAPVSKLDVPRTWALVRALVTDPRASVQWIFMGKPLATLLINHARQQKEPAFVVERALAVMHQPSDAQSHMDHWHLRIYCAPSDRYQGCVDRGPSRWLKKDIKYLDSPDNRLDLPTLDFAALALRPHHLRLAGL